ncbi:MAG: L-threonylcarbamoyladenylate synthase [Bacteroidia bacterium]|nr:L-threonylcarbamoyladenylate synthase [Bacteroidia bacterium]
MAEITRDITVARQWLEKGDVVAIPTETVYGLAGNALDEKTVAKIFEIKNRPSFDPLIVHIKGLNELEKYVDEITESQISLAQKFWPGPLTLLFKKKNIIPDLVTSGIEWVGIRCPLHPLTLKLLNCLDFPLAAPSANPFGYVSPTRPEHVEQQLGNKIPCILDGGPSEVGIESTVVRVEDKKVTILREGAITKEDFENLGFAVHLTLHSTSNPTSPGQLTKHYATKVPLKLLPRSEWQKYFKNSRVAVLFFGRASEDWPVQWKRFPLSVTEDMKEAARNLFHFLRIADASDADYILAEPLPDHSLGRAINDKLIRASVQE